MPDTFLPIRTRLRSRTSASLLTLFATGAVVEVGCWAHARRKFFEAQKTDPEGSLYALGVIRQLYAVEREVAER